MPGLTDSIDSLPYDFDVGWYFIEKINKLRQELKNLLLDDIDLALFTLEASSTRDYSNCGVRSVNILICCARSKSMRPEVGACTSWGPAAKDAKIGFAKRVIAIPAKWENNPQIHEVGIPFASTRKWGRLLQQTF